MVRLLNFLIIIIIYFIWTGTVHNKILTLYITRRDALHWVLSYCYLSLMPPPVCFWCSLKQMRSDGYRCSTDNGDLFVRLSLTLKPWSLLFTGTLFKGQWWSRAGRAEVAGKWWHWNSKLRLKILKLINLRHKRAVTTLMNGHDCRV